MAQAGVACVEPLCANFLEVDPSDPKYGGIEFARSALGLEKAVFESCVKRE